MAGIEVQIGANTEELDAAIKRSKSQLSELSSEMKTGITTAAKYGAAAAAAGAAVAVGLTVKGLAAVDAQAKLAKQLNTTSASVATLSRAAELSGIRMEQVNSGMRQFTVRLAQAADGTGPAKDALKQLNLSASELSNMPLDDRLSVVTQAIKDTVPASQQAAVAAQLFGEEAGLAFAQLSPEVLAQARKEAELFGTAVSDIDAAQVEAANDAMSTIGTAIEGISKRLAIEMAPIIQAVSAMFVDAAEEAGGFGEATSDAFDFVINSAAFVMDAVDGIKRVFELVADGIIAAWNKMASLVAAQIENIVELVDAIPGVDMSDSLESIRNFGKQAEDVASMAVDNIQSTLMRPLAGNQFKEFVAQAREASEEAAAEAINLRSQLMGDSEGSGGGTGEDRDEVEKLRERLAQRLEVIRESNLTEREIQLEKFAQENEDLNAALEQELITKEEWAAMAAQQKQREEDSLTAIEDKAASERQKIKEQEAKAKAAAEKQFWADSTSLMNSGSRKMFEIGKAASIAQAVVKGWSAAVSAWDAGMATGGPAAPAIAAAYAAASLAKTATQISSIRSASFGGGGSTSGGGGGGSVTQNINAQGTAVQGQGAGNQTLTVQGIDPGMMFSGRQLVDIINQAQQDGAILQVQS